mmetsp:Transcript_12586/g.41248  ORF Transcript_12586/g.41248 Transcript_12586/m.41248 type:complete len:253 (+) Transcript_12586:2045-2803(+)
MRMGLDHRVLGALLEGLRRAEFPLESSVIQVLVEVDRPRVKPRRGFEKDPDPRISAPGQRPQKRRPGRRPRPERRRPFRAVFERRRRRRKVRLSSTRQRDAEAVLGLLPRERQLRPAPLLPPLAALARRRGPLGRHRRPVPPERQEVGAEPFVRDICWPLSLEPPKLDRLVLRHHPQRLLLHQTRDPRLVQRRRHDGHHNQEITARRCHRCGEGTWGGNETTRKDMGAFFSFLSGGACGVGGALSAMDAWGP